MFWLLTTPWTTVSVTHAGGGVSSVGSHSVILLIVTVRLLLSLSPFLHVCFHLSSSSHYSSFLIPSSHRLLQPLRKKRKICTLVFFFSCCHQKYKTSFQKSNSRFCPFFCALLLYLRLQRVQTFPSPGFLFRFALWFSSELTGIVTARYTEASVALNRKLLQLIK